MFPTFFVRRFISRVWDKLDGSWDASLSRGLGALVDRVKELIAKNTDDPGKDYSSMLERARVCDCSTAIPSSSGRTHRTVHYQYLCY